MSNFMRKKVKFRLCCSLGLLMALLSIPVIAYADNAVASYEVLHHHSIACQETVYRTISADTTSNLVKTATDTCSQCGGEHHYYDYQGSCSCGRTWHTNGHACIHSPYGSFPQGCSNYSVINCKTEHSHPFLEYVCGKTEDSVVGTITVQQDITSPAQQVTLTGVLEGEIEESKISWEGASDSNSITVDANGAYKMYLSYKEGGISYLQEYSVSVDNIDHQPPMVSEIVASKTEVTSENVVLSLSAEDNVGLPETYIRWNGGEWQSNSDLEVISNGIYEAEVRDLAGNTVKKSITISNIDKTAPVIQELHYSPKPWNTGNAIVKVVAIDEDSGNEGNGLADLPYSWDKGETWVEEDTFEIGETTVVVVWVRDKAGNISEQEIEVLKEKLPTPPPAPSAGSGSGAQNTQPMENNVLTEIPDENIVVATNSVGEQEEIPKENIPVATLENMHEEVEEKEEVFRDNFSMETEDATVVVVEENLYSGLEENEMETLEAPAENNRIKIQLTMLGWIAGGIVLGLLGLFLFVLFGLCRVYEVKANGQENYLGRVGVKYRKKGYSTSIHKNLLEQASSRDIRLKFPKWFVKCNAYKAMHIEAGKSSFDKYVEREVDIHIQM